MMSDMEMSVEDKKWQAQSDARTLAEAEVIKGDPERLKAAQEAAVKLAEESREEAEGMSMVAKGMQYSTMPSSMKRGGVA